MRLSGHPIPRPERHRADTMGQPVEAALNAFAITFDGRMPTKIN